MQIDDQDIDVSEILFEEEVVEEVEQVEEGKDNAQEAMLTQEEQELAELELELNAMDNSPSPPPRSISPPLTEKDFAQALLASTPPSSLPVKPKGGQDTIEEIDGEFSAPPTLDALISALDFEFS